jgi:predicted MPP superfamily phosphohydrolase
MKKAWWGSILVALAVSCKTLAVPVYTLETPRFAPETSLKIVLITDLHSNLYGSGQETLIAAVWAEKPDLILLVGDIFDDIVPDTGTELLLNGVHGLAPMYYVAGNHEYQRGDMAIRTILAAFDVQVLADSYTSISINGNTIIIAGADDPERTLKEPRYDPAAAMKAAFRELDGMDGYKILLAHRPEHIKQYRMYAFDLVLSGHAHGGQIRLPPLINGLYAPGQGLFPKYAGGLYTHGALVHIVSRGLSITRPRFPRIFNPPEVVCIIIASTRD